MIGILVIVILVVSVLNNLVSGDILRRIKVDTEEVNTAVNHKETGMPTLVQRVIDQDVHGLALATDLATFRLWAVNSIQAIADALGVELPPQPPIVNVVELPVVPGNVLNIGS